MEPEKVVKTITLEPENPDFSITKKIINGIEERQRETLKDLPRYWKVTLVVAAIVLVVGWTVQLVTQGSSGDGLQLFQAIKSPSIGGILSLFFTFVAYIVNCLFAVWAVSFIPYLTFRAYRVSQRVNIPLHLNRSKWIQLFAVTFFPIFAFAIFTANLPQSKSSFEITLTRTDAVILILGGAVVWAILYLSVKFIPLKHIIIHLTIFSVLLYSTILLAYILGFGIVTYAVVLGLMGFLTVASEKLGEIARRMSIYDIDSTIAEKISSVSERENYIKIKEAETDVSRIENQLERKKHKLDEEVQINTELQKIRKTQIDFNSKVNETKLNALNQRLEIYNEIYTILTKEYEVKVDKDLPRVIDEFREGAKTMSPKELSTKMNEIINQVNDSLDTIPQGLDHIKLQMRETTKQLREATEELSQDDT